MANNNETPVLAADGLRRQWQANRRLTRKVIEAFPEEQLFQFSLGGMRPFAQLTLEFLKMAEPIVHGVATGEWKSSDLELPKTKADLLRHWDEATSAIDKIWETIPPKRFAEVDKAFGMWEASGTDTIIYAIENEIHHRGQGYVYLRALNIEPPAFWERD